MKQRVAIIIPAYNEEKTIATVIRAFAEQDDNFSIYVIDNNSSDRTNQIARDTIKENKINGHIIFEPKQGKARAIRRAFLNINADIYVMVDADMTYPAAMIHKLIKPIIENTADMVVGDRLTEGDYSKENKRVFHEGGNYFIKWLITRLYKHPLHDILSGYRAFSCRFVKTYPVLCDGFEIETDLTLHALDKKLTIIEIPVKYKDRPLGSESKLNTVQDGIRIVSLIFNIFRHYKPFRFFGFLSTFLLIISLLFGSLPIIDYIRYHYVYHIPLAILSSALAILSIQFLSIALILDSISRNHRFDFELKWLAYKR